MQYFLLRAYFSTWNITELQQVSEPSVLSRDASTFGMHSTLLLLRYVFLKPSNIDHTLACCHVKLTFLVNFTQALMLQIDFVNNLH